MQHTVTEQVREKVADLAHARESLRVERLRHQATRHTLVYYLHELAQATGRDTKKLLKEADYRRIAEEHALGYPPEIV